MRGIIFRATHGFTEDARLDRYVTDAKAAGYTDDDIGFDVFCNPKRGPGFESGVGFVHTVRVHLGHVNTFYMADVESYTNESGSFPALGPAEYARRLRGFIRGINVSAPNRPVLIYTNAAYWDPYVGDTTFGGYDIIVARYPFYTITSPVPPADASKWAGWILSVTTKRPQVPRGWDGWDGWQFSAGFNRSGAAFGCESCDLDFEHRVGYGVGAVDAGARTDTATGPSAAGADSASDPDPPTGGRHAVDRERRGAQRVPTDALDVRPDAGREVAVPADP